MNPSLRTQIGNNKLTIYVFMEIKSVSKRARAREIEQEREQNEEKKDETGQKEIRQLLIE